MVIAVLAQYMFVCFWKQLEDTHSSNVKGRTLSPKGSLEEMGPTLSPSHMPAMSKDRRARECLSKHSCVFTWAIWGLILLPVWWIAMYILILQGAWPDPNTLFVLFSREWIVTVVLCILYSAVGQFMDDLWFLKNRIQNGNASRSFLILCKAAELADSLIIPNLAEMLFSSAGEKWVTELINWLPRQQATWLKMGTPVPASVFSIMYW